jgi:hypothetical protein
VFRSLVDSSEVLADRLLNLRSLLEDLNIAIVGVALDFRHHRVTSFDSHDPVGHFIELLHLSFPQQCLEIVQVFGSIDFSGDRQLFFLILQLVLRSISDLHRSATDPFLFLPLELFHLLQHGVCENVFVGWTSNGPCCIHHVDLRLLHVNHLSQISLGEKQVAGATVINNIDGRL